MTYLNNEADREHYFLGLEDEARQRRDDADTAYYASLDAGALPSREDFERWVEGDNAEKVARLGQTIFYFANRTARRARIKARRAAKQSR
jgi:hypothetical protein